MWKKLASVLLGVLFLASTTTAFAAANEYYDGIKAKLWRGVVNTATGWIELPAQLIKGYNDGFAGVEGNKLLGIGVGLCNGVAHAAGRTASGVVDLVGFWVADPADNYGTGYTLDAEYAWEGGESYNYYDPNFVEGALKPAGKKLVRGASNLVLGVAELPGQIGKGYSESAPDLGIIKGLWYWASREAWGVYDIATAILPVPADNLGIALETNNAWDALSEELK